MSGRSSRVSSRGSGTRCSHRSQSSVDESLFGSTRKSRRDDPKVRFVTQKVISKLRSDPNALFPTSESVALPREEFERIKNQAVILSKEDINSQRKTRQKAQALKTQKARERKERMRKLEEGRKNKKPELSYLQLEDLAQKEKIIQNAQHIMDEELDDVKQMNQMVLYAQCVAIRDRQIDEQKKLTKLHAEDEAKLDQMMEEERLNAIAEIDARERRREEDRKQGAAVIIQQMRAAELERLHERELKEQEGIDMIEKIKILDEKEEYKKKAKQIESKELLKSIMRANENQSRLKLKQKDLERDEDARIATYIKEKERREQEHEQKNAEIKAQKEREIAELRAKQEKQLDHKAELDAIRARRAQESAERKWRQQEKETAKRQAELQRELAGARQRQKKEKERRMSRVAYQERREFEKMVTTFHEQEHMTRAKEIYEHVKRDEYSKNLRNQIQYNEKCVEQMREESLKDADLLREKNRLEKLKIEKIKQQKLAFLQKSNVPEKYRAELEMKKILE